MGRWTCDIDYGASSAGKPVKTPRAEWLAEGVSGLGSIPGGLREVGFSEAEIAKLTHGNWMRLYGETFRQG